MSGGTRERPGALFVDDDAAVLSAVERTLRNEAYDVVTVDSAKAALAVLGSRRIDVLMSDEEMPGMTGGQLLAIAADRYPDILRMMFTGRATLESALFAINTCHVYRYLRKPSDLSMLPIVIREAIRKRQHIALRNESDLDALSPREREVLSLVSRGVRVKDAASNLNLSEHTVRNHVKSIFRKLDAHSQSELVMRFGPADPT